MTIHHTLRSPRLRVGTGVFVGLGVLVALGGVARADGVDPVDRAQRALDQAIVVRSDAEGEVARLEQQDVTLRARLDSAAGDTRVVAEQIAAARAAARTHAVDAYMSGGSAEQLSNVLQSTGPADASARTAFLTSGAQLAGDAADAFERLKQDNDPEVVELGLAVERLSAQLETARSDLSQASAWESDAERSLAQARSVARATTTAPPTLPPPTLPPPTSAAAPAARPAATGGTPPVLLVDDALNDGWDALRQCESGGNYRAVSASGRYRGAYQFDQRTWNGAGGTGDPAQAPAWEQDQRAQLLFAQRGARAWPHCGRYLRR